MAHISADRVADTTTTTGTGNITLANSAPTGFRTLNAVAVATDTFFYAVAGQASSEWEVGLGTYSGTHVFVRTTVLASSNSDAAVTFSAGTKDFFITLPALRTATTAAAFGTDNVLIRSDDTTKGVQSTGITVDDSNNMSGLASLAQPTIPITGFDMPVNLGLSVSVAANALTIAIKGANGSDASATNPIYIPFRSATLTTGTPVWRSLTAASSLVVSSGSTLGATNAAAFRLAVVIFDDGGTLRLGVINATTIGINEGAVASSTAEGGAGAADSANTWYTGTGVTSKAFRIIGYLDYPSGLTTAGTWDAAPTTTQLSGAGVVPQVVTAPKVTVYTSGSGTHTTATGTRWLAVELIGGGGGGGGGGTGGGTATAAGNSTFGGMTGNAGAAGALASGIVAGGTASGGDVNITGGSGGGGSALNVQGAAGGQGYFGGAAGSVGAGNAGQAAAANTGGGGGGGTASAVQGGGGGGGGGYCRLVIKLPASSYSYGVGAGGGGGSAGTGGAAGGAGGSGIVIVTEYFT